MAVNTPEEVAIPSFIKSAIKGEVDKAVQEELVKGKVWIDEIDQRCLFESDVKKLAKEYGSYMFLQGIEAVKGAIGEQQEWEVEQNNGDGVALLDHVLKNLESLSLDSTKE